MFGRCDKQHAQNYMALHQMRIMSQYRALHQPHKSQKQIWADVRTNSTQYIAVRTNSTQHIDVRTNSTQHVESLLKRALLFNCSTPLPSVEDLSLTCFDLRSCRVQDRSLFCKRAQQHDRRQQPSMGGVILGHISMLEAAKKTP